MSVGGNLGWREEVSRGVSELSGEYCVENVKGEDGELYRRLVFLSNATVIQSESRLVPSNTGQFFSLVHCILLCSLLLYTKQYINPVVFKVWSGHPQGSLRMLECTTILVWAIMHFYTLGVMKKFRNHCIYQLSNTNNAHACLIT